jgi:hypothetical protein
MDITIQGTALIEAASGGPNKYEAKSRVRFAVGTTCFEAL